ncbi:hypothetical protein EVAR_16984_1 [Eumeta japonica]|uniref:Uncharacterized protein n=1 Tax=Eumeta variegata TaxID=151549 RepID=A0A4C1TVV3_EUMVA|nr:hypothetical protein EVAR_16984_1 [Eumeta japonica]
MCRRELFTVAAPQAWGATGGDYGPRALVLSRIKKISICDTLTASHGGNRFSKAGPLKMRPAGRAREGPGRRTFAVIAQGRRERRVASVPHKLFDTPGAYITSMWTDRHEITRRVSAARSSDKGRKRIEKRHKKAVTTPARPPPGRIQRADTLLYKATALRGTERYDVRHGNDQHILKNTNKVKFTRALVADAGRWAEWNAKANKKIHVFDWPVTSPRALGFAYSLRVLRYRHCLSARSVIAKRSRYSRVVRTPLAQKQRSAPDARARRIRCYGAGDHVNPWVLDADVTPLTSSSTAYQPLSLFPVAYRQTDELADLNYFFLFFPPRLRLARKPDETHQNIPSEEITMSAMLIQEGNNNDLTEGETGIGTKTSTKIGTETTGKAGAITRSIAWPGSDIDIENDGIVSPCTRAKSQAKPARKLVGRALTAGAAGAPATTGPRFLCADKNPIPFKAARRPGPAAGRHESGHVRVLYRF